MGKFLTDWDAQVNIYRSAYVNARRAGNSDDAIDAVRMMWSSLPEKIRLAKRLTKLKLDNSWWCTINSEYIKWTWIQVNATMVESALADYRNDQLANLNQ